MNIIFHNPTESDLDHFRRQVGKSNWEYAAQDFTLSSQLSLTAGSWACYPRTSRPTLNNSCQVAVLIKVHGINNRVLWNICSTNIYSLNLIEEVDWLLRYPGTLCVPALHAAPTLFAVPTLFEEPRHFAVPVLFEVHTLFMVHALFAVPAPFAEPGHFAVPALFAVPSRFAVPALFVVPAIF